LSSGELRKQCCCSRGVLWGDENRAKEAKFQASITTQKGMKMSEELSMALVELKRDKVAEAVKSRAKKGEDPVRILEECRQGMSIVGERFQKGEYFLAELLLSAEIFKEAVAILQPYLAKHRPSKPLGKVILATMKGDIHDLGKNIVATLLRAQGFEVYDLGVDVDPAVVVKKVKETRPEFVGFSALITTAFDSMKEAAEMLAEAGLRDNLKLMVGGGVTTPMVRDYVGADFQTTDAMEGVAYCMKIIRGK
jgi:methylmalonyl-CoA mutase cobalamin-binding domain/chain